MDDGTPNQDPQSDQQQQGQQPPAPAAAPAVDTSKLEKENASLKRRMGELQNTVEEFKRLQEDRKLADLETAKDYESAKAKIQQERDDARKAIEDLKASHVAELDKRDLLLSLSGAGCTDEIAVEGFLARFNAYDASERPKPADFVAAQLEAHPGLFDTGKRSGSRTPASAAPAAAQRSGTTNWEEVKAWEKGDDLDKRKEARALISAYRKEHGRYPYPLD